MNEQRSDSGNSSLLEIKQMLEKSNKEIRILKKELVLQKSEIDAQKEIIENQRDVAVRQLDEIALQQKDIKSGFIYASHIQSALLASKELFHKYFQDHFILYRPKDIVSGDFYWMTSKGNQLVVTAADSTGHGVAGAFMSVMGMVFLNELVDSMGIVEPAEILNMMRNRVVDAFGKTEDRDQVNAGMDMSLVCIDRDSLEMKFSGAFNSAMVISDHELTEIPANKMPVGHHPYLMEQNFTTTTTQLKRGDRIYLFSDGFIDQFGWRNNKKFMKKNFKELLLELQDVPVRAQKILLENSLDNWKGDLEQVDDIVVLGIEV